MLEQNDPTPIPQPENRQRNIMPIIIICLLLLLVLLGAGSFLYLAKTHTQTNIAKQKEALKQNQNSLLPTTGISQTPLFSGKLKRLDQDLHLFKMTGNESENRAEHAYYEAGQFTRGELKGYKRILALKPPWGFDVSRAGAFVLATKDFKTYLLDDQANPYDELDKNKIAATKIFDTEQPETIQLNNNFSLFANNYLTEDIQTDKKDVYGNLISSLFLRTNYNTYKILPSPLKNVTIYALPYITDMTIFNQLPQAEKEKQQLKQKYFGGKTDVAVVDSTGLPMSYSLTTPDAINKYITAKTKYEKAMKQYNNQEQLLTRKQITQNPVLPEYPEDIMYHPSISFSDSLVTNTNNIPLFNEYKNAIPEGCANSLNSYIANVKVTDLEQIGTVFNLPLYRLKNASHELNSLAFHNKMDYYDVDAPMWDMVNNTRKKPTFTDYSTNNPLLFLKDPWGRWVMLGEYDIQLPGGCGKPVIYLYPKQPTKVSVKFQAPVQFTTDIPTYADGWKVMASPNGSLTNLKPELTNCTKIDDTKKGSEYAKGACKKNIYPYLYWAGNIYSQDYPVIDKGWIVEKKNIATFLQQKITEMGLNPQEKADFLDYWQPELIAKNTPYYRVSFLQTNELNELFPMQVTPQPDTTFRIFLDYTPLMAKPITLIQPQTLNKLTRNGFTMVEWGGLKR